MGINFDSLSPKEQEELIAKWDANRIKRQARDKISKEKIEAEKKGFNFLVNQKILGTTRYGKNPNTATIEPVIFKWLLTSETIYSRLNDEDPENKNKRDSRLSKVKKFFYSQEYIPNLQTFPKEEFQKFRNNVAREMGIQYQGEVTQQEIESEIKTIKESLDPWIEYFTSKDSFHLPMWVKYWAFMGVVNTSGSQKISENGDISFTDRDEKTFHGFPELNPEALAKASEYIQNKLEGETNNNGLNKTKFKDVYAHFLSEIRRETVTAELPITSGKWVRYRQGSDEDAARLVESLKGKGTGWCLAGMHTAKNYLAGGDLLVYYSDTQIENNTPYPRIGISFIGNKIREIRGVAKSQNMDEFILESGVLEEELSKYGSAGVEYQIKSTNMKRVTKIYKELQKTGNISQEDLDFLKTKPEGFGRGEDPRIQEILSFTELKEKYKFTSIDQETVIEIFKDNNGKTLASCISFVNPNLHNSISIMLLENEMDRELIQNLGNFKNLSAEVAIKLIEKSRASVVIKNRSIFKDFKLDDKAAKTMIKHKQDLVFIQYIEEFSDLQLTAKEANELIKQGRSVFVIENKDIFSEFELNSDVAILIMQTKIGDTKTEWDEEGNETSHKYLSPEDIIVMYIYEFKELNAEVAKKMIEQNHNDEVIYYVFQNPEMFHGLELNSNLALYMISLGKARLVADFIDYFTELNAEVAMNLCAIAKFNDFVEDNIYKFTGFESKELQFIKKGLAWFVILHNEKFPGFELNSDSALFIISHGGA